MADIVVADQNAVRRSCIINFDISITRIDQDIFVVEDLSNYSGSFNYQNRNEIKIETPRNEEFLVSVPVLGKSPARSTELSLKELEDGVYCASVVSCGRSIEARIPFFENLIADIQGLLSRGDDDEFFKGLLMELDVAHDMIKMGEIEKGWKIYKATNRQVQGCLCKM